MTSKLELNEYKRFAKEACKSCGIKVNMVDMSLLEVYTGSGDLRYVGNRKVNISYVMFKDRKSGKQYQCSWSVKNLKREFHDWYYVTEYIEN